MYPQNDNDRTMGMLVWIVSIFSSVIGPAIFMLIAQGQPFVYRNALQAMMMHVLLAAVLIVGTVVTCGLGMIVLWVIPILAIVFSVLGAVAASQGTVYEPPITGQLVNRWFRL